MDIRTFEDTRADLAGVADVLEEVRVFLNPGHVKRCTARPHKAQRETQNANRVNPSVKRIYAQYAGWDALWLYAPTAMTSLSYVNSNLSELTATAVAGSVASGPGLEDDGDDDDEAVDELDPLVLPFSGNLTGAVAGVWSS